MRLPARLMLIGFLFSLPATMFWISVLISRLTGFHALVDLFFFMQYSYVAVVIVFPVLALLFNIWARSIIKQAEMRIHLYTVQTGDLPTNSRLMTYYVLLLFILVLSLLNNT